VEEAKKDGEEVNEVDEPPSKKIMF
jgi:hypothetical protein